MQFNFITLFQRSFISKQMYSTKVIVSIKLHRYFCILQIFFFLILPFFYKHLLYVFICFSFFLLLFLHDVDFRFIPWYFISVCITICCNNNNYNYYNNCIYDNNNYYFVLQLTVMLPIQRMHMEKHLNWIVKHNVFVR